MNVIGEPLFPIYFNPKLEETKEFFNYKEKNSIMKHLGSESKGSDIDSYNNLKE